MHAAAFPLGAGLRGRVIAHARADLPDEACGVIAGVGRPARVIPMANAERSPVRYAFDPAEQVAVWQEVEDRGEELLAIYHSHPTTPAYPSGADVRHACEPGAVYLIVSLRGADPEVRAFRIVDGLVAEVAIEAVPDG